MLSFIHLESDEEQKIKITAGMCNAVADKVRLLLDPFNKQQGQELVCYIKNCIGTIKEQVEEFESAISKM